MYGGHKFSRYTWTPPDINNLHVWWCILTFSITMPLQCKLTLSIEIYYGLNNTSKSMWHYTLINTTCTLTMCSKFDWHLVQWMFPFPWPRAACMDFHKAPFEREKSQRTNIAWSCSSRRCGSLEAGLDHTEVIFKHGSPVPRLWNRRACGNICQQMVWNQTPHQREHLNRC